MKFILLALILFTSLVGQSQIQHRFEDNQSFTYEEAIAAYRYLDETYADAKLISMGQTDVGKPLHVFVIDTDQKFDPVPTRHQNKRILFINNGIHPGESCGIDASIWWAEKLLETNNVLLQNTVILIVPIYNVGGALNRGCCSRTNQDGPEQYGFRGNARNLDLNRDFIKCDSRNASLFAQLIHHWDPDVFVDTHTTNGADYQHTMTLIGPNKDKMDPLLGSLSENDIIPFLYSTMDSAGFSMAPYVATRQGTPETGIVHFADGPRYSSGYVNLFHTLGFTAEAHMLKPYPDRVRATIALLNALLEATDKYGDIIYQLRMKALENTRRKQSFGINHKVDTTNRSEFRFKGYEYDVGISPVTGHEQIYYNRNKPYEKNIPYYKRLTAEMEVRLPQYFIIPQAWYEVVQRLIWNDVELYSLKTDTALSVEYDYVLDYETTEQPYEGHYLHHSVTVRSDSGLIQFNSGDYLVFCDQRANQYLANTLDPRSHDSFFNWNFFDAILMQKEWFSPYVFDLEAQKLLENDDNLRARFLAKKKDPTFAEDSWAQLYYIYQQTEHYESTHNRIPVFRGNRPIEGNFLVKVQY